MKNMRFKVGDRVRIKSIDWYNENKDAYGDILCRELHFSGGMKKFCSYIFTISTVFNNCYLVKEDNGDYYWTDEMIEGLVEEEVGLVDNLSSRWVNEFDLPDGYIFKDENGNVINATKIVLEKKKKEYPKTYEECCRVLGVSEFEYNHTGTKMWYRHKLMATLDNLMLCRDAYWKLYGDEMGLGKPWEPDYDSGVDKFGIVYFDNTIMKTCAIARWERHINKILEFPTAEMRDAFYENFKKEIEICKELL